MRIRRMGFMATLAAGLILPLATPGDVLACACCARFDEWMRRAGASEFEREEIVGLSLSRGMLIEGVGERDPLFFSRPVIVNGSSPGPGAWEIVIGTGEDESPSALRFTAEGPWEFFQTYPGPWPGKVESEVQLYKEVVLPGAVQITGSFAEALGHDTLPAKLIFKGQGGRCFSGADYSQWMLRFTLPRPDGDITFVGSGLTTGGRK